MKEISAILVEDQPLGMDNLEFKIQENCPAVQIVAKCLSGQEAIKAIQEHEPQLVFLDYDLWNMTGFQVLDRLEYLDFEVIFVTNYDEHAIAAINHYSPAYFLVKPLEDEKLVEGVWKAHKAIEDKYKAKEFLTVRSLKRIDRVPINHITYLEASDVNTIIHTSDGRNIIYTKPLKLVSSLLSQGHFRRIHRIYHVNFMFVHTILRYDGTYYCQLPHPQNPKGKLLPVGETYRRDFLRYI